MSGGSGGEGGSEGGAGPTLEGVISESPLSTYETDPQIAVNGNTIAVVWVARDEPAGLGRIGYAISSNGGADFSDPQFISSGDDLNFTAPDVVVDNGGIVHTVFVGHDRIGGGANIYLATASGGTTFSDPTTITDATLQEFYDRPRATLTNTARLLVAYTQTVDQNPALRVATKDQTATDWVIQDLGLGGNVNFPTPCAAADTTNGRTFLTYLGQGGVTLLRSEDNGDNWMGAQADDGMDSLAGAPSCVAEGDNVWVSYGVRGNLALDMIKVAYSMDGGETIMFRGVVTDPEAKSTFGLHQIALQPLETGHLVYYNGAGLGDGLASLLRVRFTPTNLDQVPPIGMEEMEFGLPGVLVHEPVELQLVDGSEDWLGSGIGLEFEGSDLYVAYVDNSSGQSHIAFKVIAP